MLTVKLRVDKRSGDVVVKDNGENGYDTLDVSTDCYDSFFYKNPNIKVLPFHCLTDREEAELLAGRAYTEHMFAIASLSMAEVEYQSSMGQNEDTKLSEHLKKKTEMRSNQVENSFKRLENALIKAMKVAKKEKDRPRSAKKGHIAEGIK